MKRTLRLTALLVPFLAVFALVMPAAAATQVDSLPAVVAVTKARYDFALTLLGVEIGYGKGEYESENRVHLTLKTVAFEGSPSETLEAILYDGVVYTRENDSTQWYIEESPDAGVPPSTETEIVDATLSLIGPVTIAGISTDQYQLWVNADDGSVLTADFFIGTRTPYLHKLQSNVYLDGNDPFSFAGTDYYYYDFDAENIKVYPPTNAIRRPAAAVGSPMWGVKKGVTDLSAYLKLLK
jgi:hypothetical protein